MLRFLEIPRTRQEIVQYLDVNSVTYAMQTYIDPLIAKGLVKRSIPDKPRSRNQRFAAVE